MLTVIATHPNDFPYARQGRLYCRASRLVPTARPAGAEQHAPPAVRPARSGGAFDDLRDEEVPVLIVGDSLVALTTAMPLG